MNAPTKELSNLTPAVSDDEAIRILGNSLYPGARPESIRMVLAWCKATGRDPMKKPIHIVPMEITDKTTNKKEWRDVLMPGIGTYRSDAAQSGNYAGKDEPEFGPDVTRRFDTVEVTFPQWCRLTVYRLDRNNERRPFTAKELWMENYAVGYQGKGVNAMWRRRPYGQLAKVAEAQALRMAFPDETGNTNTQEEMEGKSFDGPTIEAEPDRKDQNRAIKNDVSTPDEAALSPFIAKVDADLTATTNGSQAHKTLMQAYATVTNRDDLIALENHEFRKVVRSKFPAVLNDMAVSAFKAASDRLASTPDKDSGEPDKRVEWDAPANGNGHANGHGHAEGENRVEGVANVVNQAVAQLKAQPDPEDPSRFPGDDP